MRHAREVVASALGGGLLVVACVVPDVDLVDQLPGGGSGGAASGAASGKGGSSGAASGTTSGKGGTDGEGGEPGPSGGTQSSTGGAAGTAGNGGTAGMVAAFPQKSVCESGGDFAWCEPFPLDGPKNAWTDVTAMEHLLECQREQCPSPPGYLSTTFQPATPDLNLAPDLGAKVSFWARLEKQQDDVFVSFELNGPTPIKFGVEGDHFRWRYGTVPAETSAPSSDLNSPEATAGTWACIELVRAQSRLKARVVVYGQEAVQLPDVDFQPTAGEDDAWSDQFPGTAFDFTGNFYFGQVGSSVAIDEITIGTVTSLSTCDYYLQQSP
jgi:hypothetical protein